jgi:hypothetical protein
MNFWEKVKVIYTFNLLKRVTRIKLYMEAQPW